MFFFRPVIDLSLCFSTFVKNLDFRNATWHKDSVASFSPGPSPPPSFKYRAEMLKQSCQLKSFFKRTTSWQQAPSSKNRAETLKQIFQLESFFCFVEENKLTTASGDVITYDHLVIAMGLQLRFLPFTLLWYSNTEIYCRGMRRSKVCQKLSTPRVLALTIGIHLLNHKVHPLIF